jgi:two-component system, response regulator / RNA-binding antiterminator
MVWKPINMPHSSKSLRIVVINSLEPAIGKGGPEEQLPARARALRVGLLEAGYNIVAVLPPEAFNAELVAQLRPDVLIVDAETEPAATLARITAVNNVSPKPIVLFTEDHDSELAKQAVQVGVSSYIVAGLSPERVRPILEVAIARFEYEQKLRSELHEAKERLSERIIIEKAKGLMMNKHHISEEEAHKRLRTFAMEKNMKLVDVAKRLVDAAELLW